MIQYFSENIPMPALKKQKINLWIKQTAHNYEKKVGEIAYIFCNNERILEINRQYLQHDYYTDIITFDDSTDSTISGDIFISLETVKSNAEDFCVDFEEELHRVIIHGILHLCGQDDITPELKAEMTRKENKALEELKKCKF
ncbi:MAG: rRNA maturation RNase YbeY [Paludibacteraceae bacterium]|nr:rRNA maturation RNase YbeY [Paludibacteraceae bacterium]OPZ03354.1 MAG: Endoribonuclease YbeY [Bacteroidetes bacterium ADurb.BinA395]HOF97797.1 rRNA maturation RNase YbeY [Paludibacteraceae bacterium]HPD58500.1 rRNA maturation RNase YbeY [Paludibacteraceae bacterium]